ncbi:MAG TPA: TonB-dependent receptor [Pyrinomonadaceae bacterium]|nr:TonB-dependent receptor [Pyrinomonadaceae bacterium]
MSVLRRTLFVPLFLSLLLPPLCAAQQPSSAVVGTVTDPAGAAVVGARISVAHAQTSSDAIQRTATDAQGRFTLAPLAPGAYVVSVEADNFAPAAREIQITNDATPALSFQLALASVAESVTVVAGELVETAGTGRVPGGVAVVGRAEIEKTRAQTLKDVFALTPGVLAQSRWGSDESQLSIRGSGLRNNFHSRGVNLLVNGIPYQDADGFTDFESLDLRAMQRVDVWKGANALRFGGNTMGGAINFVTQTGATAPPLELRVEGGSFGFFKGQLAAGGARGRFDYYASFSDTEFEGYREHSRQGRQRFFANAGWRFDDRTELRFDLVYANVAEKLPGSLTRRQFFENPRQADANNVRQDWGRFYDYARAGLQLRRRLDPRQEITLNLHAQYRDMDHPIFQVIDQDGRNFGGEFLYRYDGHVGGRGHRLVVGLAAQLGDTGERRFANLDGSRGPMTARFNSEARNVGLYFEDQFDVRPSLTLVAGGRLDRATRRFRDLFMSDGDRSDTRSFAAFSPKFGFVWRAAENAQVFGNVSRSYEPPLLLELTSFGAPGFLDLKAQDTWQYEVGTRGRLAGERVRWDVSVFDAEIRNELVNVNARPFPGAPFTVPSYRNAARTRHRGLEAGADVLLARELFGTGRLDWRTAYTWSSFRFRSDTNFGDNFIPGAPRHLLRSELHYAPGGGLWLAPGLDWSPATYFADSANTVRNDKYAAVSLRAGYDFGRLGLFVEGSNLTDRIYSASVQVDSAVGRFFEPAAGRSVQAGLRWNF